MAITIDTAKSEGRLVANNERYRIHDYDLGDLTISLTELKGGKATRGHSHDSTAEAYFFMGGGEGEMTVGGQSFDVRGGAILIPQGEFHKVANKSEDSDLTFVSVFAGKRNEGEAVYGAPRAAAEAQRQ